MVRVRNDLDLNQLLYLIKSSGIDLNFKTGARGHQGFFAKDKIRISKKLSDYDRLRVLIHEFAHYVHFLKDKNFYSDKANLKYIFDIEDNDELYIIRKELEKLVATFYDDKNYKKLYLLRDELTSKIKECSNYIKINYPKFKITENFKEFNKYSRGKNLKYLLKYDRVLIKGWFFKKDKILSISNIKEHFPDIKEEFIYYLKLKSYDRRRKRISNKISKINRYLNSHCELFARFIEYLFTNPEETNIIAENTCFRFKELVQEGFYPDIMYKIIDFED